MFLHAFTIGDTTSSFFKQGNIKIVRRKQIAEVFRDPKAHPNDNDSLRQLFLASIHRSKNDGDALYQLTVFCVAPGERHMISWLVYTKISRSFAESAGWRATFMGGVVLAHDNRRYSNIQSLAKELADWLKLPSYTLMQNL